MGPNRNRPDQYRLRAQLSGALAGALGLDPSEMDPKERLSRYGLDSVRAVSLAAQLGEELDQPFRPSLFWEFPTVAALAAHLSGDHPSGPGAAVESAPGGAPVAIVGIAGRFPGARDPEGFRSVLVGGTDQTRAVPPGRWGPALARAAGVADSDDPRVSRGGFLGDPIDGFDAAFFGISPREAREMDPQQRLVLELAWEALEDAGIPPASLEGTRAGVFAGVIWHDYAETHRLEGAEVSQHTGVGQALGMIANRVSYSLGLRGPSISLDTACSSSAVAVHLACRSLRTGEATAALAVGVNLMLAPSTTAALREFGGLSPDGRCRPFDARANGFVRGEGAGVVVLKPLDRAMADGDRIYCVIAGSAVNNDGASNGLTAPSREAQEAVLREAYRDAGVDPSEVDYVEAHGTGTSLGDPIEAGALGAVLGRGREPERPLRIGSLKGGIGHLEGAAGVAGLIKASLMLYHRELAPSVNHERPNPHIDFDALGLRVQREAEPWPDGGHPRRAGVSAFGWGGTNCHLVLEEHPGDPSRLVRCAAEDEEGLQARVREIRRSVGSGHWPPEEVRPAMDAAGDPSASERAPPSGSHRLSVVADSPRELVRAADAFLAGGDHPGTASGVATGHGVAPVFVYSPHGSQWVTMGRALLHEEAAFRRTVHRLEPIVREETGWSLVEEMLAGADRSSLARVDVAQPMIVCVQLALTELWRARGVTPGAVLGHSLGEISAAHAAGILHAEAAARLACRYSRIQTRPVCRGGMAVVALGPEELDEYVGHAGDAVAVAGLNGPRSTLLAGDPDALDGVVARCREDSVFATRVAVPVAVHGPRFSKLRDDLERELDWLRPAMAEIPMISTVTGETLRGPECTGPYWSRNLCEPVRFWPALAALVRDGHRAFVEVSPHPVLLRAIGETLEHLGVKGIVLPTLRRGEGRRPMLESQGELWVAGVAPRSEDGVTQPARRSRILPLSARSQKGLRAVAGELREQLRSSSEDRLADLCHTAAFHRAHHPHRLALLAGTRAELAERLDAFLDGRVGTGVRVGRVPPREAAPKAFVFSGQGAQWWDAARDLVASEPTFRRELGHCAAVLREVWGRDPEAELTAPAGASGLHRTEVAQPVLFAVQVALAGLWRSWGIEPDAVLGHSVGEVAAAHVAGALSLEQAARVITERSRVTTRAAPGRLVAVELGLEEAEQRISSPDGRVFVAAVNSPRWTVLSGDAEAVEALQEELLAEGTECRILPLDRAFHTPAMEGPARDLVGALEDIAPLTPSIPIYSTVSGTRAEPEAFGPEYWGQNLRQPVLFAPAMREMLAAGVRQFLEIGPHPVLAAMVGECAGARGTAVEALVSLRRGQPAFETMLDSLGALHVHGTPVAWGRVVTDGRRASRFPRYPWQRKRFWFEPGSGATRLQASGNGEHSQIRPGGGPVEASPPDGAGPLPGRRLPTAIPTFECTLLRALGPLIREHRMVDVPVMPASGFLALVAAAAERTMGSGNHRIEDLVIHRPLAAAMVGGDRRVQVALEDAASGRPTFRIHSAPEPIGEGEVTWSLHATGRVVPAGVGELESLSPDVDGEAPDGEREITGRDFYADLERRGLDLGGGYRTVESLRPGETRATGIVRPARPGDWHQAVDVSLLDGLLQCCLGLGWEGRGRKDRLHVVNRIERVRLPARGLAGALEALRVRVTRRDRNGSGDGCVADVRGMDGEGKVRAELLGVHLGSVVTASLRRVLQPVPAGRCYRVAWEEKPLPSGTDGSPPKEGTSTRRAQHSPADIAGRLQGVRSPHSDRLEAAEREDDVTEALDSLAAALAARAVFRLGVDLRPGDRIGEDLPGVPGDAPPGRRRFLRRLLEIAAETGSLEAMGGEWLVKDRPESGDLGDRVDELLDRFPDHGPEIRLLARCGGRLAEVLRGEEDPLSLLFSSGGTATVETLYREALPLLDANRLVAGSVAVALSEANALRPLRLLEVGAGTGATTDAVLEHLPSGGAEYHFTDVSPALVRGASERLQHPSLRFGTLDLEDDPGNHPETGHYDLVVAANVLHATRDVRQALAHVRRLLVPGGLLVLLETTVVRSWVDVVFGMTDGWWRFDDDVRSGHPLLPDHKWLSLLEDTGFAGAVAVAGSSGSGGVLPQTLLLASAPGGELAQPRSRGGDTYLLFTRGAELGRAVAQELEGRGDRCIVVEPGNGFEVPAAGPWRIRRGDEGDYRRLVREAVRRSIGPLRGAILLWPAEQSGFGGEEGSDLSRLLTRDALDPLYLIKALEECDGARLWTVTAGAQPAADPDQPLVPSQAALWGLGRGIALRHPRTWGGLIDLSDAALDPGHAVGVSGAFSAHAARILAELDALDGEDQVALRGHRRLVPRLQRVTDPDGVPFRAVPGATYIVTGGLGRLGRKVARWLVECGAGHLVLVGRRGLPPREARAGLEGDEAERARAVEELEELGAEVDVVAADVGDREEVFALVEQLRSAGRSLRGVVHAAADLTPRPLADLDAAALRSMYAPKAAGAWWFHEATRELELDFFVLFSSTTSLLGAPDLAHYAAANQFLAALAHLRRAQGLPALTVDWGTWDALDALAEEERERALASGQNPMDARGALETLGSLLSASSVPGAPAQVAVADIEWNILRPLWESRRRSRFLERIESGPSRSEAEGETPGGSDTLPSRLSRAGAGARRDLITAFVEEQVRAVLGLSPREPVDPEVGFFELGMDSLMSVQLKDRIEAGVGESLPGTLTLNHPNVHALSRYLMERLPDSREAASRRAPKSSGGTGATGREGEDAVLLAELEEMSEEEVRRSLMKEVAEIEMDAGAGGDR